jgi:hypothetical protein
MRSIFVQKLVHWAGKSSALALIAPAPSRVMVAHIVSRKMDMNFLLALNALLTNHSLSAGWGLNHRGQLGDGTQVDKSVPTPVSGGGLWLQISTGGAFSCGVKSDGSAWCEFFSLFKYIPVFHATVILIK